MSKDAVSQNKNITTSCVRVYSYAYIQKVHNHLSAHLPSVIHLTKFMKSVMKVSFTSKKGWPFIAQLPGDIRDSVTPRFGSNLLAYQVSNDFLLHVRHML